MNDLLRPVASHPSSASSGGANALYIRPGASDQHRQHGASRLADLLGGLQGMPGQLTSAAYSLGEHLGLSAGNSYPGHLGSAVYHVPVQGHKTSEDLFNYADVYRQQGGPSAGRLQHPTSHMHALHAAQQQAHRAVVPVALPDEADFRPRQHHHGSSSHYRSSRDVRQGEATPERHHRSSGYRSSSRDVGSPDRHRSSRDQRNSSSSSNAFRSPERPSSSSAAAAAAAITDPRERDLSRDRRERSTRELSQRHRSSSRDARSPDRRERERHHSSSRHRISERHVGGGAGGGEPQTPDGYDRRRKDEFQPVAVRKPKERSGGGSSSSGNKR